MFCPNCGTKNMDGTKFCFKCGASLEVSSDAKKTSCDEMKAQMSAKGFVLLEESDTAQKWKNFDADKIVEIEKIDSDWCKEEVIPVTATQNTSKINKIVGLIIVVFVLVVGAWVFGREKLGTMKFNNAIKAENSKDYSQASELYKQSCDYGNMGGCNNLGFMYDNGNGVVQDYSKALKLYKQGCDGGHAPSCTNLGYIYDNGRGVVQDYTKAVELYKQGCNAGNATGCYNLGLLYDNGHGVAQNYRKAAELYKLGCDGGDTWGCFGLGSDYAHGKGVAHDNEKALELYQQACNGGYEKGCTNYKELNAKINPAVKTQ